MLISNSIVKHNILQDLNHYLYNYIELLNPSADNAIRYYVADIKDLLKNMNYAIEYEDELNIIIYSQDINLLEETILRELIVCRKKRTILKCYNTSCLSRISELGFKKCEDKVIDQFGVYGIAMKDLVKQNNSQIQNSSQIIKITSSEEAKKLCTNLDLKKWNYLPRHLQHFTDRDTLYLKYINNEIGGYLWTINSIDNYHDIGMLWVPIENRRLGIGTSLVRYFKFDMIQNLKIPYYGNCSSIASKRIAEKCNFQNIWASPAIYSFNEKNN